ncbi:chemotaxis protein CheB [Caballeronia sp. INDeC2]|uniref:chemotaxis protein CheB n=1 Tax=Caballeronia sp. INDeC2 TaxID=2921747 RepID=UPI0032EFAFF4
MATSTGGLAALSTLMSAWPANLPASVFVVMHVGVQPSVLPKLLQRSCALRVQHAENDVAFHASVVYVAPPDRHLVLHDGKTLLSAGPKENFTRPSADPLFRSAAINYGPRVIGIVLTGHLDDGAAGLKAVDACGGFVAVQDPEECVAPGMPENALHAVKADVVASVAEISSLVMTLLEQPVAAKAEPSNTQRIAAIETETASTGSSSVDAPLRNRCRTGHAFSGLSLEEVQRQQTENALWSIVRALQERLTVAKQQLVDVDDVSEQDKISARIRRLVAADDAAYGLLRDAVHDA